MVKERHILLFRFSAIGDIAIAAPLIRAYAVANPGIRFTMVSQPLLEPLFMGIDNLHFFPVDFKGRYKGFKGLIKLFSELCRIKPTQIADIHNVLRTWILRTLFFVSCKKIAYLHKGRAERRSITRKNGKELRLLPSMISRYESVLNKIGLADIHFSEKPVEPGSGSEGRTGTIKIGIAPFAKHKGKAWPFEYIEDVVSQLGEDHRFKIFLFGGGKKEIQQLMALEQKYSGVESVAGKYGFETELELIGNLDLMVSMDSANMHLASFKGVPVLSIWGATHPYAGFYGWGQKMENAVQLDMGCRPCSVFGNKECLRGDYACMKELKPDLVLNRIFEVIKVKPLENK